MKRTYAWLTIVAMNCHKAPESGFPVLEPILIDPVGPSREYREKLLYSKTVEVKGVITLKTFRNIYVGKDKINKAKSGKDGTGKEETGKNEARKNNGLDTILVTRHSVSKDFDRGWFYAERFFDEDGDGFSDRVCDTVGMTVIGGIYKQQKWECRAYRKQMSEIMREAERWIGDPDSVKW